MMCYHICPSLKLTDLKKNIKKQVPTSPAHPKHRSDQFTPTEGPKLESRGAQIYWKMKYGGNPLIM